MLTPSSWPRVSARARRRRTLDRARRRRSAGDADGADRRAVAAAPRLRRQRQRAARRLRAPDRPAQGRADQRRGLRALGGGARRRRIDAARRRSSASSPRSTGPTSGCWPRPARATPATCPAMRCGWSRERPRGPTRFEHVLVDDAQELDLAPARLARASRARGLTVAGDPAPGCGASAAPVPRGCRASDGRRAGGPAGALAGAARRA